MSAEPVGVLNEWTETNHAIPGNGRSRLHFDLFLLGFPFFQELKLFDTVHESMGVVRVVLVVTDLALIIKGCNANTREHRVATSMHHEDICPQECKNVALSGDGRHVNMEIFGHGTELSKRVVEANDLFARHGEHASFHSGIFCMKRLDSIIIVCVVEPSIDECLLWLGELGGMLYADSKDRRDHEQSEEETSHTKTFVGVRSIFSPGFPKTNVFATNARG